jgi:beta-N-acetylhexosaminidase
MVDHEGGRVVRFERGVTRFPDARTVGRSQGPEDVARQGRVEAEELSRLGVRVNLAPCVDVVAEGSDPIIGDRSYGSDPARVSELAVARIQGLQSHGVAACAKHFPGLGAVPRDPHKVLPTIPLNRAAMERVHLVPFRAVIEAGVAMIMSSHVCYPGLGEPAGLPATFSPRLIRSLLRTTMRYDGLILTDDLEMGALRAFGTMGEAAVRATEAGHDILLICSDLAAAKEALSSLRAAYQGGRLPIAELERSVARLERVKRKFLAASLE